MLLGIDKSDVKSLETPSRMTQIRIGHEQGMRIFNDEKAFNLYRSCQCSRYRLDRLRGERRREFQLPANNHKHCIRKIRRTCAFEFSATHCGHDADSN